MAVLQIHVIREQLRHRIDYVMNQEKTACKGFHSFFGIKDTLTSGFTCACDEAYQQMMETKQHEKKTDKVLGYHYIQSFKPGEVTPEEAHQVGCEFIERCFAEDFEVVIGTHTDHAHIHNHIILNSVSFRGRSQVPIYTGKFLQAARYFRRDLPSASPVGYRRS